MLLHAFSLVHAVMAASFAVTAVVLIVIAARIGWTAVVGGNLDAAPLQTVIEAIGFLAAAVVALQIAQTVAEGEVVLNAHVGAHTRARRFLSRFLVVVAVALAIEGLVATARRSVAADRCRRHPDLGGGSSRGLGRVHSI